MGYKDPYWEHIPFCTHEDMLTQKGENIKALGIITAEATEINYEAIKQINGFYQNGDLKDIQHVSFKKLDRVDINTSHIAKKYNMSLSTVKNMLKRLDDLDKFFYDGEWIQPISVERGDRGKSYWINHKAYGKYYTLIRRDVLEELLLLPVNALKLYLVIKYNYDLSQRSNKPCVLDMKYLCRSIGLSENSRSRISPVLFKMDGEFIKIKHENRHNLVYTNNNLVNAIKTEYTYEILK